MPDQPAKPQRFEVGMRVRVQDSALVFPTQLRGMTGVIDAPRFQNDASAFRVNLDKPACGYRMWGLCADELEPAPAAQGGDPCTE